MTDSVLPPMNAHQKFKKGQEVFVVAPKKGVPHIFKTKLTSVGARHVKLKHLPKSWYEDKNKSPFISNGLLHVEGAWFFVHTDEQSAVEERRRALVETMQTAQQRVLTLAEKAIKAEVIDLTAEVEA